MLGNGAGNVEESATAHVPQPRQRRVNRVMMESRRERLLTWPVSSFRMFLIMGNMDLREPSVHGAASQLGLLLPDEWSVAPNVTSGPLDGQIALTAPDGTHVAFDVHLKRWTTAPTSQLRGALLNLPRRAHHPVLLVSNYLNRPMRQACEDLGVSYIDTLGWTLVRSDHPALFIRADGRDLPAPRVANEVTRLNGVAAGRVIRALLELEAPLGVRQLAHLAGVSSPGSVSKILPTLVAADAIRRDSTGQVTKIYRRRLLERWTQDYSFLHSNGVPLDFLAPRGLEDVLKRLPSLEPVAITGAYAARQYLDVNTVPVVPASRLALYIRDMDLVQGALGLYREDRSRANVILVVPKDKTLLETPESTSFPSVSLPQCLADLLTLPGRESSLADQIIDQLAIKDPTWKN